MYYMLFVFYLLLLFFDQFSKEIVYRASNALVTGEPLTSYLGGILNITYVENHGGVFGTFQGKIAIFTIVSTILIIYVIYTEWENFKKTDLINKIGVIFIAAGATGNMIDRFVRGFVIDMIDFHTIWSFIFNVADVYIHIGVYILILRYLYKKTKGVL